MFDKIGLYNWIYKTKYLIPFASIFNSLAFEMAGIFFFNLEWGKALIILKNMRYSPFIIFGGLFIYVFNILIGIIVSIIFGLFLITLLVALESIL